MRKLHQHIRKLILDTVDLFYPLFQKMMPLQTFRYAACGGFNTCLDITLFFISYNYILQKQPVHFGFLTIGAHIAAFLIGFCVTFPIGFYLSRYVVFQATSVAKREQLGKYFMVVLGCLFLNYGFLKLFVDVLHWYPTPSKLITTLFVVAFSYVSQKHFTFKAA
ncbi:Putative flippase GtrA (transmembrane translocase of bactoprenol-linked glucose) [Hydrobacter penzbergensis]|uniref:Flippase GtrA (Transmembrane translocase of bactoprenol-linked glucose) n=1 Tax=Hydrobacter penzbergensis TaxID=1235997 RepID=A0A8X8I8L1_9BACT|nr:GtrA family protein [Hydrobacter penzbergensis]SDW06401.1 Putative flippase GtrA (transmembrane translocase of bactoprenol-linked glucose) [Hydrobacter penzbergensis]